MALAGEAAVRLVPSLKGFHRKAQVALEAKRIDYEVNVTAQTAAFHRQMMQARALQESKAVTIPVRTDWNGLKKDLSQVEHIFERNNLVKGIRFNIKVIGLDALPAMAYAAGSAASGLDALGKSVLMLPAAFSAAGASIGAMAVGLSGIKDAFGAYGKSAKDSTQNLREFRDAQRDLGRAQRDVSTAIRDQRRELEDLNAELRRSTLDEADALLNLQESADRLKQGGFKSITEYQRAQVRFLRDVEGLKDVRKNNLRLQEDTNAANEKGIAQGDRVVAALDKVTGAVDRLNQSQEKLGGLEDALSKVSPNARAFIEAAKGMEGAWNDLKFSVQDNLFAGLDQSLKQIASSVLPGLKVGLGQVATGLNANIKAAVDAAGNGKNAGFWEQIFGNTQGGLENFKNALDPIITGFSRLSAVGSEFLPRLGQAFATVGDKFDAWTERIAADGTLKQWINQGLDALTNVGNIAKNVISIISSVGEAFNAASGTEGGFIGYFARETKELAEYLKGDGRQSLRNYFGQARELIEKVKNAFGDMKPLINDIIDAARVFTGVLLPVVGTLAKLTTWVEEHTRLVSNLFLVYASYRTLRPIWDGLAGAVQNYTTVVQALSRSAILGNHFESASTQMQNANIGLTQFKSNVKALGGVAYGASSQLKPYTGQLSLAAQNATALFAPTNNLTSAFGGLGDKAKYAHDKVGTAGTGATLRGALGGLAKFIGPALGAGVLGVALSMAVLGVDKLGEAHDRAKDAAQRQTEALSGLKGALDQVTGAASAASLTEAAQAAQKFNMGPAAGGERNVLQDVQNAGIASPLQLTQATLPQNQAMADDIRQKAVSQAASKIANSESYTKFKSEWDKAKVTPEIIARAQMGEPDALAKIADAERNVFGKPRDEWNAVERALEVNAGARLPSISDTITSAGTFNEASTGTFLRRTREDNVNNGLGIQEATRAAGGKATLNAAGMASFGKFGASARETYATPDGLGYLIVTSDPGKIDPAVGSVEKKAGNQWQINLTEDGTKQFLNIERKATGGLIQGKGTGTSDSNLMLASRGEFVTRKNAVDHYGPEFFQRLNNMELPKFAPGGEIPPPKIPWVQQAAQALQQTPGISAAPAPIPSAPAPAPFDVPLPPIQPTPSTSVNLGLGDPNAMTIGRPPGSITPDPLASMPDLAGGLAQGVQSAAAASADPWNSSITSLTQPQLSQNAPLYKDWYGDRKNPVLKPTDLPAPSGPAAPPKSAAPAAAPMPPATAPGPVMHGVTGGAPIGPVPHGNSAVAYKARVMQLSAQTGIPPALLMRYMPQSRMMGRTGGMPYAGLPKGTAINYGQAGFPDWVYRVAERFGVQASTYAGHQEGSGVNKGIDWSGPPENMRAFAQYLTSSGIPGLEQVIFMDPRDGAKFGVDPGDRGADQTIENYYRDDWAGHMDHVHTRMSSSIPTPEELAMLMGGGGTPGMGLPGVLSGSGLPGGMAFSSSLDPAYLQSQGILSDGTDGGDKKKKSGLENLVDYWTNTRWLEPENVENFLADQARNVGSSLLNIGMSFLSGLTGIDLSGVVGIGQQVGNFAIGTASGSGSSGSEDGINTDVTELNSLAGGDIEAFLSGQLPLGNEGGLDGLLGPDASAMLGDSGMAGLLDPSGVSGSWNAGGGAEQWRPVVRRVLETYGPQYGLTNLKAWEDAIVRQIDTESKGNPGARNPNDSDGKGGKQSVNGLLQFLPETFAANNITGGDYMDPTAQIAAVIPYVVNKYGMDENGAPKQIGRGVGYARGGKIKGIGGPRADANLVRVSRGEFLHNANAVDYYGSDFLSRLNAKQIPKETLPGFADGMWWNPLMPIPAAPQTPGPLPGPAPAPPTPPGAPAPATPMAPAATPPGPNGLPQETPLPSAPLAVTAPSTGGAPGPGATAPATDPGALPSVEDALAGIGGLGAAIGGGGGGGLPQPGAQGNGVGDARATLGMAPVSQEHNLGALSAGIKGAWNTVGGLAAQAAQIGASAAAMGASGGAPVPGASQAGAIGGQLIQSGAQIAGEVATGAVNILSSLLVGTATAGSTASPTGVPLLPQRQPMQTGVPAIQQQGYTDNRTYNLTNLDEYRAMQERDAAQRAMPWISKF